MALVLLLIVLWFGLVDHTGVHDPLQCGFVCGILGCGALVRRAQGVRAVG